MLDASARSWSNSLPCARTITQFLLAIKHLSLVGGAEGWLIPMNGESQMICQAQTAGVHSWSANSTDALAMVESSGSGLIEGEHGFTLAGLR